jgi:GNAT superfamily N-acetyltransferase
MTESESMSVFVIRPATLADLPVLTETQRLGFAGYAAFSPPGWTPPAHESETRGIRDHLERPGAWCAIAHAGGEPAGHVGFVPGLLRGDPRAPIPGLAHVWALFIREPWWGSGLARELHALAMAEAQARGYRSMRLYTPARQARARRFYEREGWVAAGPPFMQESFGMDVVEYRRELTTPRAS